MSAPSDDLLRISLVCARHDASVPTAQAIGAIIEEWREERIGRQLPILGVRDVRRAKLSYIAEMYLNSGFTINFSSEHDLHVTNDLLAGVASKLKIELKIDYMLVFYNDDKTTLQTYNLVQVAS